MNGEVLMQIPMQTAVTPPAKYAPDCYGVLPHFRNYPRDLVGVWGWTTGRLVWQLAAPSRNEGALNKETLSFWSHRRGQRVNSKGNFQFSTASRYVRAYMVLANTDTVV